MSFYGLYAEMSKDLGDGLFNNFRNTCFTLFNAALGQFDLSIFNGYAHQEVAISLYILYTTISMIILLNLVIARMAVCCVLGIIYLYVGIYLIPLFFRVLIRKLMSNLWRNGV